MIDLFLACIAWIFIVSGRYYYSKGNNKTANINYIISIIISLIVIVLFIKDLWCGGVNLLNKKHDCLTDFDIQIIKSLANNNLKIKPVSEELHCHRNTVVFHMELIQNITGYDANKFWDMLKLLQYIKALNVEVLDKDGIDFEYS